MSLNSTPSAERIHIAFFGKTNAGKSSLVNAVTGQDISVVSEVKGTTTDPVYKSMELLPAGPVMIIDTPGFDDKSDLGQLRIQKTRKILEKTDLAVLVTDAKEGKTQADITYTEIFKERNIPYITVFSRSDLLDSIPETGKNEIYTSALTGYNINELKNLIASVSSEGKSEKFITGNLLTSGDKVILVIPIDAAAPKGRLILPQQMVIREILDKGAAAISVQPESLSDILSSLNQKPKLIITDSQAFREVSQTVPEDILLTSFSILMANYKGVLSQAVSGLKAIDNLKGNDRILISEGCTHHRQCGDIGTVKLPALIEKYTGVKPVYDFSSGTGFPDDLSPYKLIIHCGGCMINEREVSRRAALAADSGIPFTNYGTAISYMNGILKRTLQIFPEINSLL